MAVTLGYAEPVDDEFGSEAFPSKIGGRPRWLDPTRPLAAERVLCGGCSKPMGLLMQLYAPEDAPEDAFHRMLYVFICRNGACHAGPARDCMRVVRAQLPEANAVYRAEPGAGGDDDDDDDDDNIKWVPAQGVKAAPTCVVCGLLGNKRCSGCRGRAYCSRGHQVADWDAGHRAQCSGGAATADHARRLLAAVYPERVIASEEEDDDDDDDDSEGEDTECVQAADMALVPATGERAEDSEVEVDPAFLAFQRRIRKNPDQVIRYGRSGAADGEALFVSAGGQPTGSGDIPDCGQCGAGRQFEFQIMPQMLNHLGLDAGSAIDWGTLLVYSCPRSCSGGPGGYADEVVWRQGFSAHGIGEKYLRAFHGGDSGALTRQFETLDV
ncbi:hypothetical protein H4R18_001563 [Coemansia javaensis]|uniref:MYND-type domain-containing protein n=1 Tax=Coemansia javaensis TaxID=2761396 RepID=A0A9W8LLC8_9FUNG|nr:hypothetical protein H4R18_001563 [Coemansia javaensis]